MYSFLVVALDSLLLWKESSCLSVSILFFELLASNLKDFSFFLSFKANATFILYCSCSLFYFTSSIKSGISISLGWQPWISLVSYKNCVSHTHPLSLENGLYFFHLYRLYLHYLHYHPYSRLGSLLAAFLIKSTQNTMMMMTSRRCTLSWTCYI